MNYTPLKKEDFDKSFKFEKQTYLCYSGKKLKEITPDKSWKIAGLARRTDKDTEDKLVLGNKFMAVFDSSKDSPMYRNIGYVPVGENEYIAVQENMLPVAAVMGTMTITTALICMVLLRNTPAIPDEVYVPMNHDVKHVTMIDDQMQFNPLPPVDTNLEDCDDSELKKLSDDKPKAENGGGKVTVSYRPKADLTLSSGEIKMEYQNPANSSHDAVLALYVVSGGKEYEIASSGRIPAGKQLKSMKLSADKNLFAAEGKYDAEYKVYYYDPVTGERALAEAAINDITLTVRK